MFLGEPPRTAYDLQFSVMGFAVRVHPFFWLAALILGSGGGRPDARSVLVFTVAMFVSILLHELGHAFAFRYYGISSHVVLYMMGGLAVPDGHGMGGQLHPKQNIVVSAAGPGIQLALAGLIIGLLRAGRYAVPFPYLIPEAWGWSAGAQLANPLLTQLIFALLYINIFWALINLLPVYPLDGGQIARELFMLSGARDGVRNSLILSICTGAGVALWGLQSGIFFLGIMFGLLAYSSYQTLQAYTGGGFGGGFGGGGGGRRPW